MNVIINLRSNTRGITSLKANDEDLSSDVKNSRLRHACSKVLKGSFYVIFLDNELKSIGSDPSKEGNDESPIIDMKQGIKWNNIEDYNNDSNKV